MSALLDVAIWVVVVPLIFGAIIGYAIRGKSNIDRIYQWAAQIVSCLIFFAIVYLLSEVGLFYIVLTELAMIIGITWIGQAFLLIPVLPFLIGLRIGDHLEPKRSKKK